jgi:hypothetical protein
MNIREYTTVTAVKEEDDTDNITDDVFILGKIRQVSAEMEDISNRWFNPRYQTRYFDTPRGSERNIFFDADIIKIITLTNGDGNIIPDTEYLVYPLNGDIKERLFLSPSQFTWQMDKNGYPWGAISIYGVWGYHADIDSAWEDTGLTISGSVTSGQLSFVSSGSDILVPGDLVAFEDEYVYISAVNGTTNSVIRGVNGSIPAAHNSGIAVQRWKPGQEIVNLCTTAVVAYYMLRQNPTSESVSVDGMTFKTPKDIKKWIERQMHTISLTKLGIA